MLINKDSFQTQSRSVAKIHFATCKSQIGNLNIGDRTERTEDCQSCHRSVSVDAGLPGRLRLEQQSVRQSRVAVGVSGRERGQFGPPHCHHIALLLQSQVLDLASNCDWHCVLRTVSTGCIQTGLTSPGNQIVSLRA